MSAKESPEARTHPLGSPGHPRYSLGPAASLAQNSAAWFLNTLFLQQEETVATSVYLFEGTVQPWPPIVQDPSV